MSAAKYASIVVYTLHLIINGFASQGGSELFPDTTGNVSKRFRLEITPVPGTFTIWVFIFVYQFSWLAYNMLSLCRRDQANVLSTQFYLCFNSNIVLVTVWLILWSRYKTVGCSVVITLAQMLLNATIAIAAHDLYVYTKNAEISKFDLWCQRILVQNGLLFYAAWTTVAAVINSTIVIVYNLHIDSRTASIIGLTMLLVLLVIWFVLENFIFAAFLKFTLSPYVSMLYACVGIFMNTRDGDHTVNIVTICLLVLTSVGLLARMALIMIKSRCFYTGTHA